MPENKLSLLHTTNATIYESNKELETPRNILKKIHMSKISKEAKSQYKAILVSARKRKDDFPIPNRHPWHCKLAVTELLNHAQERQEELKEGEPVTIRLLTGSLTNHVYDDELKNGLQKFLESGGKVNIIIWGKFLADTVDNPLIKFQNNYENLKIRFSQTTEGGVQLNHFFLVDDDAYRFEAPHPYYPPEEFTDTHPEISARIVFNDKDSGTQLKIFFDDLWRVMDDLYFSQPVLSSIS
ncbi:hypothetical protein [Gimesia panareensis]|uniref:hypothetical protein n=1 Tax=Gimesia panareensis TaxID=2527978 RepID=UPI00118CA451|nr:hypothetical protein [Gimesia panareensis]QDU52457.1 hypothetical protein Pan110_48350 [Gimesia panareensis]